MKTLEEIKNAIKSIQTSFNPAKSTYKTLDKLINNEYSINEMIYELSKIKGIEKYPEELKKEFNNIVSSLKELEKEELKKIEEERKKQEKQKQEEKTKEIKDILDSLEKELNKKKNKTVKPKDTTQNIEEKKETDLSKISVKNQDTEVEESNNIQDNSKGKMLFKILLIAVIITFITIPIIFFFY